MSVYTRGTRCTVHIRQRDGSVVAVPGVCLAEPTPAFYTNKNGAQVASPKVEVVSLRRIPDREPFLKVSQETVAFLELRSDAIENLDFVEEDGARRRLTAIELVNAAAAQLRDWSRRQRAVAAS